MFLVQTLKKRKVIIILYLKIVQSNDIIMIQLALFSAIENNILTKKDVIQMVKSKK